MERHLVTCPVCKTDQHIYGGKICNHEGYGGIRCLGSRAPLKQPNQLTLELVKQACKPILNQDDWLEGPDCNTIARVVFYSGRTEVLTVTFHSELMYTITQAPVGVRHLQDAMTYGRAVSLIQALKLQISNLQEFVGKQVI